MPPTPVASAARVIADIQQQTLPAANTNLLPQNVRVLDAEISEVDIWIAIDIAAAILTVKRTRGATTSSEILNSNQALTQNALMAFTVQAKRDDQLNLQLSAGAGNVIILTMVQRPYKLYVPT